MPKEFVRPVPVTESDTSLISINLMMIGECLTRLPREEGEGGPIHSDIRKALRSARKFDGWSSEDTAFAVTHRIEVS